MTTPTLPAFARRERAFILSLLAAAAVTLAIALENWIAVALLAAIPLILLAPVEASLGVFAFLVPFDSVFIVSESGTTLNWFIGAAAAAILLFTGLVQGRLQAPPRAALWWGLLVTWCIISIGWALDQESVLHRAPTAISLLLVYLVAVSFRVTWRELRRIAAMALIGGVAAAGWVVSQGFSAAVASRVSLGEAGPNLYAATMLLPGALTLCWILLSKWRTVQVALIVALLAIASSVFFSMSRGGLLALATVLLIFVIRYRNWRLLLLIALLAVPLLAMPDLFFHRLEQGLYNRGTGRFDIWHVGWAILRDHGLLGVGLDNFRVAYVQYAGEAPIFRGYSKVAHNVPLQVAAEMGVVGLALFVAACRAQLQSLARALRRFGHMPKAMLVACEAACWGMLVMGLSLDIMWRKAFWLVWILATLAVRLHNDEADLAPVSRNREGGPPRAWSEFRFPA